jgi:hypothetical protein
LEASADTPSVDNDNSQAAPADDGPPLATAAPEAPPDGDPMEDGPAEAPAPPAPPPDPAAEPAIELFAPDAGADKAGYMPTPADRQLDSVYGDHVHGNDGSHLDGGTADDLRWQRRWRRMVQASPARYSVPKGAVGRRFLAILTSEFHGARNRRWNSERPLVFAAVILQTKTGVRRAGDIRRRLTARMDLWTKGRFAALVDDTEVELQSKTATSGRPDEEARARAYNARVLSGRLRSACRILTRRDGGGVLDADGVCSKSGRPVLEVLQAKHPELRDPTELGRADGAFEPYAKTPAAVPADIGGDQVAEVAARLSGAAGPGGTDAVDLRNWLLRFGTASEGLRNELASWTSWLANSNPPWAAYRALMACRLVALDKQPGTRPVGIGEIYRRLFTKCLLKAVGDQATAACGNFNLCAGLPAGIEGACHAIREDWHAHPPGPPPRAAAPVAPPADPAAVPPLPPPPAPPPEAEQEPAEPHGVLLVDAANGFNELGRKAMLWTVRHRWAAGARFAFNCYRHSALLILRRPGRPCHVILSQEGVTQGDPLSMVLYGVALVPLAEQLRAEVPRVLQPWYADDCAMAGPVSGIAAAMALLETQGPRRGYYPEPAKSIFVGRPADLPAARAALESFDFQYHEGHRYIGGYVGSDESMRQWLAPQIQQWVEGVRALAGVARRFPQTAYAGLARSLQTEWTYLQRVIPGIDGAFGPIEDVITREFIPALLGEDAAGLIPARDLLALSVRFAGLGIPDPVQSAALGHRTSVTLTQAVTQSLRQGTGLHTAGYVAAASKERRKLSKERDKVQETVLDGLCEAAGPAASRRMKRATQTGAWLTTLPDLLNGTELAADEFRDSLRLRFGLAPANLPARCDGCSQRFTVEHAMSCRQGGLVLQRHNDVAAEWHHLCAQALNPRAVSDEPLIPTGQDGTWAQVPGAEAPPELRGDVAVHGFWTRGRTAVFDIRVTDTDAPSFRTQDPAKVLAKQERQKTQKYGAACAASRRHFTPLVFSVDGMRGAEAVAASKRLASGLARKWKRPYSQLCGFVRSRLSIALARAASRCLRSAREPIIGTPSFAWVSDAALALYH